MLFRPDINLFHLLGWRNSKEVTASDELLISESGQYFPDFHPLLTIDNVKSIAPDFKDYAFDEWEEKSYKIGDLVNYNTQGYKCIKATEDSPEDSEDWAETDPLSEWILTKTKASTLKLLRTFFNQKLINKTANSILESRVLFEGAGRIADLVPNTGHLVGFEITPIRAKGVTLRIEKIGTQFVGTDSITLYLFNSENKDSIQTIEITRGKNSSMEWSAQEIYLPFNEFGGTWFLLYDQNQAPMAVNKDKDWSQAPCTCSKLEYSSYITWSKYVDIMPFRVNGTTDEMFDIVDVVHTPSTNYGLNIQFSLLCDLTDIIEEQRDMFTNLIGLQVAIDFLREFAYNPQFRLTRGTENFNRNEILYELDGTPEKKGGLTYELSQALKAVDIDISGIYSVCMPCKNGGIKYKAT